MSPNTHIYVLTYNFELNARIAGGTFVEIHPAAVRAGVGTFRRFNGQGGRMCGRLEIGTAAKAFFVHPMGAFLQLRVTCIETACRNVLKLKKKTKSMFFYERKKKCNLHANIYCVCRNVGIHFGQMKIKMGRALVAVYATFV